MSAWYPRSLHTHEKKIEEARMLGYLMGTKDTKLHIEGLCKKYNVDPSTFIVGYGKAISSTRITFDISTHKQYQCKNQKYAMKYIDSCKWYIVWNLTINKSYKLSVSREEVEKARQNYTTTVKKNLSYPGWGKEVVSVFDEIQLEAFIRDYSNN